MTENAIVGAPDLVVEILSAGTAQRDLGQKKALYLQSGVREYWVVDPKHASVAVFVPGTGGESESASRYARAGRIVSAVLGGFEVPVAEVFRSV